MTFIRLTAPFAVVLALAAAPAHGQTSVTTADIQRLQDSIYDTSRDIAQLRTRSASSATELERELDDARDDVTYLRVKVRRNEPVTRTEYADIRDRIDDIRARARGTSGSSRSGGSTSSGSADRSSDRSSDRSGDRSSRSTVGSERSTTSEADIPVGTEFDVRLQRSLNSGTAQVEDRFEATTLVEISDGDRVLIPAGSVVRGIISSVTKAGRIERKGSLTVAFDQITVRGRNYPIRATVTEALESEGIKGEAGKIGTAAGVGAIIGGILGGFKGALAGILIGGGGTIAATEGEDVNLPVGTVLRVRLDQGLDLR